MPPKIPLELCSARECVSGTCACTRIYLSVRPVVSPLCTFYLVLDSEVYSCIAVATCTIYSVH